MKILVNCLLIVAAAAAGLGLGFALRAKRPVALEQGTAAVTESSVVSRIVSTGALPPRTSIRYNDDSPLATKLERDLSMSKGVVRWLYWLEAIEKATQADFPRLARLAQGNSTAMRFVAARWVEVAPRHLFDTIVREAGKGDAFPSSQLANVLFEEWPKRDPDAVIAALTETPDFGPRKEWQRRLATGLVETDPERGLRLMSEWHIDNHGPRTTGIAKWAAADPKHAAEFTLQHRAGYASQIAMDTIGKEWAKTDPAAALAFAAGKPGELSAALGTSTMKEWATRDLDAAATWLAEADPQTRNRLNSAFVEVWAKQDAAGALAWCESNLTGSSLAEAVGSVMKGAAAKNVATAADLVSAMPPSRARAEAAASVARKWMPEFSSSNPVKPETIAWMSGLDPASKKRILEEVHWRWSESDPQSMAAFIASSSAEEIPSHAYNTLARSMARKNPAQALEWASQLPGDRAIATGGDAFREWRQSQPDVALRWLQDLPQSDSRRRPFFTEALRDIAYDSNAAEHIAHMTGSDRAAARGIVQDMNLPQDRRARLLGMLNN